MARVLILVEGKTEKDFVDRVLAPHLYGKGFQVVSAKLMGHARQTNRRGGIRNWVSVRDDIVRHLTEDRSRYVSTMVDYYALPGDPKKPERAWPGRFEANELPFTEKARSIETKLQKAISIKMGKDWDPKWFIPYVMMHEFEAILFSDCEMFAYSLGREALTGNFQAIRDSFSCPEEINDSEETSPSHRIKKLIRRYKKPLDGVDAAEAIGLATIRQECPGFSQWLDQLEVAAK